jgi:hypothetical protein
MTLLKIYQTTYRNQIIYLIDNTNQWDDEQWFRQITWNEENLVNYGKWYFSRSSLIDVAVVPKLRLHTHKHKVIDFNQ